MNSVNLIPIDIDPSEFGKFFDLSRLDFENEDRQRCKESVLKILRFAEKHRRFAFYKTP